MNQITFESTLELVKLAILQRELRLVLLLRLQAIHLRNDRYLNHQQVPLRIRKPRTNLIEGKRIVKTLLFTTLATFLLSVLTPLSAKLLLLCNSISRLVSFTYEFTTPLTNPDDLSSAQWSSVKNREQKSTTRVLWRKSFLFYVSIYISIYS